MRLDIHHNYHADQTLQQRLDWLYGQLERLHGQVAHIISNQESIMATLDEVLQAVKDESTQEDSVVVLLQQLREQIAGLVAGNLPPDVQAKVDAVFTGLQANKAKLAGAIANTGPNPPAPAPVPAPNPAPTPATGT